MKNERRVRAIIDVKLENNVWSSVSLVEMALETAECPLQSAKFVRLLGYSVSLCKQTYAMAGIESLSQLLWKSTYSKRASPVSWSRSAIVERK